MNENILQIENLSKYFGGLAAVSNCSLKIKKGSITGIIGPNGSGKTTTAGKIAEKFRLENKSVILAAADTFRAAAVAQLEAWGERTGAKVVSGSEGSDSAAVAFRALEKAKKEQADIVIIDTGG